MTTRPTAIQSHGAEAVSFPNRTNGTDVWLPIGEEGLNVMIEFAGIFVGTFSTLRYFSTLCNRNEVERGFTRIL